MSDLKIIVKSSDFISNIDEIYKYSIWKLCSDSSGNNIIAQSIDDNPIETVFEIPKNNIRIDRDYYLFVKSIGYLTSSDWSTPITVQFKEKNKFNAIELNFTGLTPDAPSIDAYLNNYFEMIH